MVHSMTIDGERFNSCRCTTSRKECEIGYEVRAGYNTFLEESGIGKNNLWFKL
jgi:hypothetical protein